MYCNHMITTPVFKNKIVFATHFIFSQSSIMERAFLLGVCARKGNISVLPAPPCLLHISFFESPNPPFQLRFTRFTSPNLLDILLFLSFASPLFLRLIKNFVRKL